MGKGEEIEKVSNKQLESIMYKQIESVSKVSQKSSGIKLAFLTFLMAYLIKQSKDVHLFSYWE